MIVHRARILAWLARDAAGFFEWLARQPWYARIAADWVETLPAEAGDCGLEVGCGPGLLTGEMQARGVTMTGLDRSPTMVERARRNAPDSTFVVGDALALPMEDGVLDIALAASVVNVISAPRQLVGEMARVVRRGGHVSVLFPTPHLSEDADQIARRCGLEGLSRAALAIWGSKAAKCEPEAIVSMLGDAGLSDVRVAWFFNHTIASVTGRVP